MFQQYIQHSFFKSQLGDLGFKEIALDIVRCLFNTLYLFLVSIHASFILTLYFNVESTLLLFKRNFLRIDSADFIITLDREKSCQLQ